MEVSVSDLSKNEVKSFANSRVWKCIEAELRGRLESTHGLMVLAPPDDIWGENDGKVILERAGFKRMQGEVATIEYVLDIPESYVSQIKLEKGEIEDGKDTTG